LPFVLRFGAAVRSKIDPVLPERAAVHISHVVASSEALEYVQAAQDHTIVALFPFLFDQKRSAGTLRKNVILLWDFVC
jgi:hypothetical protein